MPVLQARLVQRGRRAPPELRVQRARPVLKAQPVHRARRLRFKEPGLRAEHTTLETSFFTTVRPTSHWSVPIQTISPTPRRRSGPFWHSRVQPAPPVLRVQLGLKVRWAQRDHKVPRVQPARRAPRARRAPPEL